MKECYREINFRAKSLDLIEKVNKVITEYREKGYDLTLRQVYYQLVAADIIPNKERSYKNLGSLVSDGRMAGLIDWMAIVDRTRNLRRNSHWSSPADIISSAMYSYQIDKWVGQENYVEVWVEKDALIGVVGQICTRLDVPYFSCRGYVSQSEMWSAAQRLEGRSYKNNLVILHLGDHDPSGVDMSRDIVDRLSTFGVDIQFKRIALNMNQIEEYDPPPNPTKVTDSRSTGYINRYGHSCWELDALKPEVMSNLIETHVNKYRDMELFMSKEDQEETEKETLRRVVDDWKNIERRYR